ncbi:MULTISPECIES: hypothetical protein [unclassified Moorena]|uniref:hypothetical protein n=1 Tax=unclassified Moorena TaxID=2683338 RepID=UPI0002FDCF60|nr:MULTISPECIES: hypothetical protein [unclassified Moorena]NEQ08865.1 hypothetical protein [Moorena sp. SIO4E2]NEQ15413.1 hypothetical protein [Moorena sp. SIO3E2]NEP36310.1 hypothetical protein [Moorena sp. SIO3B2]NER88013.1 hypothetical protein [Moorena sp. SIO3A2]NES46761.1 hypothetical protein [Moorena sp. SIO2C4]
MANLILNGKSAPHSYEKRCHHNLPISPSPHLPISPHSRFPIPDSRFPTNMRCTVMGFGRGNEF